MNYLLALSLMIFPFGQTAVASILALVNAPPVVESKDLNQEGIGGKLKPAQETKSTPSNSLTEATEQAGTKEPVKAETSNPESKSPVQEKIATIAEIELKGTYREGAKLEGLFGDTEVTLSDILSRILKAGDDKSIQGIILKINSPDIGYAQSNEFRQAISKVRAKGKPVYAYIEFGILSHYMIAGACDKIYLPESGDLMITGLRMEISFYKKLFELLEIKPDFLQIGDFKGAAEPYTRSEMSPEFKQDIVNLLDGMYQSIVEEIAAFRHLKNEQVTAIIDQGPFTAPKAKALGLIDGICYYDQLGDEIKQATKATTIKLVENYGKKKIDTNFDGLTGMMKLMEALSGNSTSSKKTLGPKVAVIYANGPIMTGKSSVDPFSGEVIGSDTIVAAIKKAANNSNVKAIVLRVNSPGGSALASDLIWRALENANKPLVVSMGNVAASGGYYISMGADHIFVEPGTITGSIGVVAGKLALGGLFNKVGITTEVLARGKNSGVMSITDGFSDSERKVMRESMEEVYELFTTKAATGRKMDHAQLKTLAGGRVYTGHQAVKNKLADEIGTLQDAIEKARKLGGIGDGTAYELYNLPEPPNPLEMFLGPLEVSSPLSTPGVQTDYLMKHIQTLLPADARKVLAAKWFMDLMSKEHKILTMPFVIEFK